MKKNFFLVLVFTFCLVHSQKYATRSGQTSFIGSEKTFEQIKAKNNVSTAIIDSSNGDIAILLFISAFEFEIALMQEHFNENYMESNKYPRATFVGRIQNFNYKNLTDNNTEYEIVGVLTMRGIEKNISIISDLSLSNKNILLETRFNVLTSDFDIRIPKVVRNKISKEINIVVKYELVKKL